MSRVYDFTYFFNDIFVCTETFRSLAFWLSCCTSMFRSFLFIWFVPKLSKERLYVCMYIRRPVPFRCLTFDFLLPPFCCCCCSAMLVDLICTLVPFFSTNFRHSSSFSIHTFVYYSVQCAVTSVALMFVYFFYAPLKWDIFGVAKKRVIWPREIIYFQCKIYCRRYCDCYKTLWLNWLDERESKNGDVRRRRWRQRRQNGVPFCVLTKFSGYLFHYFG